MYPLFLLYSNIFYPDKYCCEISFQVRKHGALFALPVIENSDEDEPISIEDVTQQNTYKFNVVANIG